LCPNRVGRVLLMMMAILGLVIGVPVILAKAA
jgi:hypothetical protein